MFTCHEGDYNDDENYDVEDDDNCDDYTKSEDENEEHEKLVG